MAKKRRVFYSFHYARDAWRASQVRNIGVVEGNTPATDNAWETVKRGGDAAIKRWINGQMLGRSCVVVLIGSRTASRQWVKYEISKAWIDGKGLLGVHIHNLKNQAGLTATKGNNPFNLLVEGTNLSRHVPVRSPASLAVIRNNLTDWIEDAIERRNSVA